LEIAKWLYDLGKNISSLIDIHANNEDAFISACDGNHLEVAKWLYDLGKNIFIN